MTFQVDFVSIFPTFWIYPLETKKFIEFFSGFLNSFDNRRAKVEDLFSN